MLSPAATSDSIPESRLRHVSELDLAQYDKDEFTVAMVKNIMLRCFSAFDVQHTSRVDGAQLKQLLEYLGTLKRPGGDTLLAAHPDGCSFEEFWQWWHTWTTNAGEDNAESFAMVSAQFSVPFHVQQLLVETSGEKFTPGYRVHFKFQDQETGKVTPISPWHDIPLFVRNIVRTTTPSQRHDAVNFITEIPKWTRAKFEISRREPFNPIVQDIKNGVPRFYKHGDMMWNYGAFPQTWESTDVGFDIDGERIKGDNDPLDGIEIGSAQLPTGHTGPVKVLGVLGMIDDGEMDWKIICISTDDPSARFMNDLDDVPKFLPGCLEALREWLRVYKIAQGGEENRFAFGGEYKNKEFAMRLLLESHGMWQNLRKVRGVSVMQS